MEKGYMQKICKERDESELFTIEELLDPNFFENMVYLEYSHSSGLGGPGAVFMIMQDSSMYQINLGNGFPYADEWKIGDYIPLLDRSKELPVEWRRCKETGTFIRAEYLDEFEGLYGEMIAEKAGEYVSTIKCAAKLFKCEDGSHYLLRDSYEELQRMDKQRRAVDEERVKLRLTNEDVDWIEVPMKVCGKRKYTAAHYVLLFTETDRKNIYSGVKWTIVERKKEIEGQPMSISIADEPAQSYVLFYTAYSNMAGILKYRDNASWYSDNGCYDEEYSTLQDGVMEKGEYVDSYLTLEMAKDGALYRSSQVIGWGGDINKETLVRFDWSNINLKKMQEETRKVRLWKARQKLFIVEHYKEICEAAEDYAKNEDALNMLREEVFKAGIPMQDVRSCIYDVCKRIFGGYTMDELVTSVRSLEKKQLRDNIKTEKTKTGYVVIDTAYIFGRSHYETMVFEALEDGSVVSWEDLDYARAESFEQSVETHLKMIEKWKQSSFIGR